ncbi:MAG: HAMP domain-containing histidine kinase [Elusimicrobia bacterium]|nr:HAMP domain-containing histidine kinase [Elusimicrobiota bacterium]
MTLRARFTLFIAGVVLATVAAYTAALLAAEAGHFKRQAEAVQWRATEHLARVCGEAALTKNELTALNFFKELQTTPHLLEALCVAPSGLVWLRDDLGRLKIRTIIQQNPLKRTKTIEDTNGKTRWIYTVPLLRNGRVLAAAQVVFDGQETVRSVHLLLRETARRSFGVPIIAMGLAILLSWFAARALTRPILKMAVGARRLAKGDWSARVPTNAPGELGELGHEFNLMSERLGELDRLKDQFVHTVSHDLRNPLGAVATSVRMIRGEDTPARVAPLVDIIETSVVRLEAMVSNILDTARLREGPLTYDLRPVPLSPIVNELARLYQPVAEQSRKTIGIHVAPDLPPVQGDEEKIRRVFLNLLTNAFKFTRAGDRIEMSARPVPGGVEMKVKDTGVGIEPDRLQRLFVPFRSTDGATGEARKGQGTGLGLFIVKSLVEGQGGQLRVESVVGQGTTFTFTLPTAAGPS